MASVKSDPEANPTDEAHTYTDRYWIIRWKLENKFAASFLFGIIQWSNPAHDFDVTLVGSSHFADFTSTEFPDFLNKRPWDGRAYDPNRPRHTRSSGLSPMRKQPATVDPPDNLYSLLSCSFCLQCYRWCCSCCSVCLRCSCRRCWWWCIEPAARCMNNN